MRFKTLVSFLGCLLAFSGHAAAQDATTRLAKKHYELGTAFYDAAEYEKAVEQFRKAHDLSPRVELLFNIARAYEHFNVKHAVDYYKRYLKDAGSSARHRSTVELRIKNLEKRVKPEPEPEPKPEPKPAPPPASAPVTPPPIPPDEHPSEGSSWRPITGWIALGVGAACLATGFVFGYFAEDKAGEYEDNKNSKTYEELTEIDDAGRSYETGQVAMMVTGGVLAAAGAGLLVWDLLARRGSREAPARAAPIIGRDLVGFGITGSF